MFSIKDQGLSQNGHFSVATKSQSQVPCPLRALKLVSTQATAHRQLCVLSSGLKLPVLCEFHPKASGVTPFPRWGAAALVANGVSEASSSGVAAGRGSPVLRLRPVEVVHGGVQAREDGRGDVEWQVLMEETLLLGFEHEHLVIHRHVPATRFRVHGQVLEVGHSWRERQTGGGRRSQDNSPDYTCAGTDH